MIQQIQETCGLPSIRSNATMLHEDNATCIAQIKGGFIKGDITDHISPKFFFIQVLSNRVLLAKFLMRQLPYFYDHPREF